MGACVIIFFKNVRRNFISIIGVGVGAWRADPVPEEGVVVQMLTTVVLYAWNSRIYKTLALKFLFGSNIWTNLAPVHSRDLATKTSPVTRRRGRQNRENTFTRTQSQLCLSPHPYWPCPLLPNTPSDLTTFPGSIIGSQLQVVNITSAHLPTLLAAANIHPETQEPPHLRLNKEHRTPFPPLIPSPGKD